MKRHKCKLYFRTFTNGRSLGGHVKAHLATLPLLLKPQRPPPPSSPSLSYFQEQESKGKALVYGLRDNPKKSIKLADPEFSSVNTGFVVQDRQSEIESKNPTRLRSKLTRTQNEKCSRSREIKGIRRDQGERSLREALVREL